MTIKELKELIKDLPDDTEIYVGASNNPDLTQAQYQYTKTCEESYSKLTFK